MQSNYQIMSKAIDIDQILESIPHEKPFRFIDGLETVSEEISEGHYFFKKDEYFYKGHYPDLPITPSVILIETMAQIGLIPLGIANYKIENPDEDFVGTKPVFTNSDVKFISPVFPETKVIVEAKKVYFRLNRLKAQVKLFNEERVLCASGVLSGIILNNTDLKI